MWYPSFDDEQAERPPFVGLNEERQQDVPCLEYLLTPSANSRKLLCDGE
jgi:hypothetical protein